MTETTPPAQPTSPRPRWRRWALEGLIFLAAFIAFQFWQTRHAPGGPAPHFAGVQVDGQSFDLASWRQQRPEQARLIYFWAEWCAVCKTTAGNVSSLSKDWPVITIAIQSGPPAAVGQVMGQRGYHWPALADPEGEIFRQYGFRGVPAFIIIDPSGNIRSVTMGYTSEIGLGLRLWWANTFPT